MRQAAPAPVRGAGSGSRWCILAGFWVLPAVRRAVWERRADAPAPRSGAGAPHARSWEVRVSPTSRSATFTARLRPSWGRPERSGGPAGLLERARVAQWDFTTCSSPLSPPSGVSRFPRERSVRGAGLARSGAAGVDSGKPDPDEHRVPWMASLALSVMAHHNGCERIRRSVTSRTRARSCTVTGPRWSSDRCKT